MPLESQPTKPHSRDDKHTQNTYTQLWKRCPTCKTAIPKKEDSPGVPVVATKLSNLTPLPSRFPPVVGALASPSRLESQVCVWREREGERERDKEREREREKERETERATEIERDKEREMEREFVCVCERENEKVCVYVCVRERERDRGREREIKRKG